MTVYYITYHIIIVDNRIVRWEYPAASRRWGRFTADRRRLRGGVRVWALSDVYKNK